MRSNALTRTLVSLTAVAGIAGGSLAIAGTGVASTPSAGPAARSATISPNVTVNLGLSVADAKNLQHDWLKPYWGYTGAIDGKLGTNSWKAMQRFLKRFWQYAGPIDGIVGSGTVKALQRLLKGWGYTGKIDGIAGPKTQAAFKKFAEAI